MVQILEWLQQFFGVSEYLGNLLYIEINIVSESSSGSVHSKTYKKACIPLENSNQHHVHLNSLISHLCPLKEVWLLHYPHSAQRTLIKLHRRAGWAEFLMGAHYFTSAVSSCSGCLSSALMAEHLKASIKRCFELFGISNYFGLSGLWNLSNTLLLSMIFKILYAP